VGLCRLRASHILAVGCERESLAVDLCRPQAVAQNIWESLPEVRAAAEVLDAVEEEQIPSTAWPSVLLGALVAEGLPASRYLLDLSLLCRSPHLNPEVGLLALRCRRRQRPRRIHHGAAQPLCYFRAIRLGLS
jgi:hypothetical protein